MLGLKSIVSGSVTLDDVKVTLRKLVESVVVDDGVIGSVRARRGSWYPINELLDELKIVFLSPCGLRCFIDGVNV
jgi:hypothetical protein